VGGKADRGALPHRRGARLSFLRGLPVLRQCRRIGACRSGGQVLAGLCAARACRALRHGNGEARRPVSDARVRPAAVALSDGVSSSAVGSASGSGAPGPRVARRSAREKGQPRGSLATCVLRPRGSRLSPGQVPGPERGAGALRDPIPERAAVRAAGVARLPVLPGWLSRSSGPPSRGSAGAGVPAAGRLLLGEQRRSLAGVVHRFTDRPALH